MTDENQPDPSRERPARGKPGRSRLRRILDQRPEARSRLGRAIAILLGTGLVSLAAIGALSIWHLVRRGRLIRERLNVPRIVRMPELPDREAESPS